MRFRCPAHLEALPAYFTRREFQRLNPGQYHDAEHSLQVARVMACLARTAGIDHRRMLFLEQVAMVHDADERVDGHSGDRNPLRPPRVQVTLHWMERRADWLSERFGWSPEALAQARALIARTDFPFDRNPRVFGTPLDGLSPVEVYRRLLASQPASLRGQLMQEGLMLRFADQVANYASTLERALRSVSGLVQELRSVGVQVNEQALDTGGFLRAVGTDLEADLQVAAQLGVRHPLPTREELLSLLPACLRLNLDSNHRKFNRPAQGIA